MKAKKLLVLSLSLLGLLVACNTSQGGATENTSQESTTSETATTSQEEEAYVIKVYAPTGVSYELNKQRAKKGEEVVLTLHTNDGYTINEVTLNNAPLTGNNGVYTFTMPNRSALINVTVSVDGDVTLVGEVVAKLELEPSGIYVARNVKVNTSSSAKFSYQVKGNGGEITTLSSQDLDENKCFGHISFAFGSDYALQVASGCTYDFFYDPAAPQYPCYIQRVNVDALPSDEKSLYTLFDGSYRSESTVNYPGLNGITYKTTNKEDSNNIKMYSSEYRVYENNVSYEKVNNTLDDETYHVYKKYDAANGVMKIVDTFTPNKGNDDRTRFSYNSNGQYAATFDVVDLDSDENGRFELSKRQADYIVNHSSHYGYYLERDFMYAYRVGTTADNVSYSKINIVSTPNEDGTFTTTINSTVENDFVGDAYYSEVHEAYMYEATLVFYNNGAVKSLDYLCNRYSKDQWNFSSHVPATGAQPVKLKTVNCTYTYGEPYEGAPEFDETPYFISSINKIRFYNAKSGVADDGNKSVLHYADKVLLTKYNSDDMDLNNVAEYSFAPATALDFWQYGPTASSNEEVIVRKNTDLWNQMTCIAEGNSDVTFTNHTKTTATYTTNIEVKVNAKFRSIYLYGLWGYPASYGTDTWNSATISAGGVHYFQVGVTPSDAPVIYNAVSNNTDVLKIVSTGEKLGLDTTHANITEATRVAVTITSDLFETLGASETFYFTVTPAAVNPVGTWNMVGYEQHAHLVFSDTDYTGTTSSDFEGAKTGYIVDDGYQDDGTSLGEARFAFYYVFKNGNINARIISVNITNNSDGWSTSPADWTISFYYDALNDIYGVFLAEASYDSYYEDYVISPFYGNCDSEGEITGYTGFSRAA